MKSSRTVVIAGGPVFTDGISSVIGENDLIICADSGADTAMRCGIAPSLFAGDMDSVSPEGRAFAEANCDEVKVFPVRKDMTDAEIALELVPEGDEILFICSLTGRPDHVMANLLLAGKLCSQGRSIILTDGRTEVRYLRGPGKLVTDDIPMDQVISIIPFEFAGEPVCGVTLSGVRYPLENARLYAGDTLTVSNCRETPETPVTVEIKRGVIGVFTTPEV